MACAPGSNLKAHQLACAARRLRPQTTHWRKALADVECPLTVRVALEKVPGDHLYRPPAIMWRDSNRRLALI
jgi:hypothetical protein